jgi:SanA protein
MKKVHEIIKMFLWILMFAVCVLGIPRLVTELYSRSRLVDVQNAPIRKVAIVFGAGLHFDGSPTTVLKDRIATAVELYRQGKVEKILMSGDNRFIEYNEPGAMLSYALELGMPSEDVVLDFAGRRTYDTCYRAKAIFGVKKALLVTQRFHLPRAVFLCNQLGVEGIGVVSDQQRYSQSARLVWQMREVPATLVALWDVWIRHPLPVLGNPEPIFGDQSTNSRSGTNLAQSSSSKGR